ncbi:helix-turn-helix domain-containing protein [Kitasatospora sp. CM 4170]|nr:helix-turn-helix domain-containing protein [Kitasatospora sp. CM 4170]WNM43232.1 helix-turn-helix domain-containing protein [Kitasatospora sp. CM 4170]
MGDGERAAAYVDIGTGYVIHRGPSVDGSLHAHAAFQLARAPRGEVVVLDAAGARHSAAALLVAPMVRHRMQATAADVVTVFIEPHCAFADRLRERCAGRGITAAGELHGLGEDELRRNVARPSARLDARLLAAMDALAAGPVQMPALAAGVGLSPQRLRALAQRQLGMPLARWRIWRRLAGAAEALREGGSLAEAAATAGFADQAHFTRQLREMTGLTPSAVLPLLRAPAPAAAPAAAPVSAPTPAQSRVAT